jgi:serine phosphatase RsbU (regulator of sigma subunit)
VQTRLFLLHLHKLGLINRERINVAFIYLAVNPREQQRQIEARASISRRLRREVYPTTLWREVKATIIFVLQAANSIVCRPRVH